MTDYKQQVDVPPWDGKIDISVIIPFNNEGANVIFTAQSIIEELDGFCKYEVILVDNCSDWYIDCSVKNERMPLAPPDRPYTIRSRAFFEAPPDSKKAGCKINTMFFRKGIVKYIQYDSKQGHWNAKNAGITASRGKYLFFLDAHCIMKRDSMRSLLKFAREMDAKKGPWGGAHAYINYIMDSRSLEYRPQKNKFFGYQFCTHQQEEYFDAAGKRQLRFPTTPYKVCVMSTCGMLTPRVVLQELGGWHTQFGIYCGGEGYMNFKQSTCGFHHWIVPQAWCWHWADKRGYIWNHRDYRRNELVAAYVCGGNKALDWIVDARGSSEPLREIADEVVAACQDEREFIKSKQIETLEEYFDRWIATPGTWK